MFPIRDTTPTRHFPVITLLIILANIAVFVYELSLPPDATRRLFFLFGLVPARYSDAQWAATAGFPFHGFASFFTSMFLHGGWMHIIANMWMLWVFGDNIEDRMGRWRFLLFYITVGILAALVHFFVNMHAKVPLVGASGAVAGVLGAYFILFPRAWVLTVIPIFFWPFFFEVPAVVYLFVWFLIQIFSGTASDAGGTETAAVAWWAHIGGFAAGVVLHRAFLRKSRRKRRR